MKTTLIISKDAQAFQLITDAGQFSFAPATSDALNNALLKLQGIHAQKGVFAKSFGGAKLQACITLANGHPADDGETLDGVTVAIMDGETFDKAIQLVIGKFASTAIIAKSMSGAKKITDAITAWKAATE